MGQEASGGMEVGGGRKNVRNKNRQCIPWQGKIQDARNYPTKTQNETLAEEACLAY